MAVTGSTGNQAAPSNNQQAGAQVRRVFLVGPTGVGKSSLGNLLVNPKKAYEYAQTGDLALQDFRSGDNDSRCTTVITEVPVSDDPSVVVADTPGTLEASMRNNLENMRQLLETLRKAEQIGAVLVLSDETRLMEGRATEELQLWNQILNKDLRERNIIIVRTKRVWKPIPPKINPLREMELLKERENSERKLSQAVARMLGVDHAPPIVDIDSQPDPYAEEHWRVAHQRRNNLLDLIRERTPIAVGNLRFPKTPAMLAADKERVHDLRMQMENVKLISALRISAEEKNMLEDVAQLDREIMKKAATLEACISQLSEVDTDDEVVAGSNGPSTARLWGGSMSLQCDTSMKLTGYRVSLMFPEYNYVVEDKSGHNGTSAWAEVRSNSYVFGCGRVGGTLYATSTSRIKHANLIKQLHKRIDDESRELEAKHDQKENKLSRCGDMRAQYESDIEANIQAMGSKIVQLEKPSLDISEVTSELLEAYLRTERA